MTGATTATTHARKTTTMSRLAVPSGGADPQIPHPTTKSTTTTVTNHAASASSSTSRISSTTSITSAANTTLLPSTTTARLSWNHNSTSSSSSSQHNYFYLQQRLFDVRQMDIQSALDQMRTLLSVRPQLIYKTAYYRKQTKNHWARDDPAFMVLQFIFLAFACFAYSIAFKADWADGFSFWTASVLWNWLGLGIVLATTTQTIANRHLQNTSNPRTSHVQQQVEWLYAFDIHCNSFFPVFVVLYGIQFFTLPVVLGDGLFPLFLANTMYGGAMAWYWYITHLGYRALPFLANTEVFLFPIALVMIVFLTLIILYPFGYGVNAAQFMAKFYFL